MKIDISKNRPQNERYLDESDAYLEDAIAEYIYIRESVASAFLFWIIHMGSILHKHREELKKMGKWMDFCSKIDLHIAQANQQIRMYELSLENSRIEVIKKTITNWTKLNMFMSLDDEKKEELLDLAEGWEIDSDTSAHHFKELIGEIKGDDVDIDIWVPSNIIDKITGARNPLHEDNRFAAETIRKASWLSHSSKPFLEAYSSIQKWIDILKWEDRYPDIDSEELRLLMEWQISELAHILWNIAKNGETSI